MSCIYVHLQYAYVMFQLYFVTLLAANVLYLKQLHELCNEHSVSTVCNIMHHRHNLDKNIKADAVFIKTDDGLTSASVEHFAICTEYELKPMATWMLG